MEEFGNIEIFESYLLGQMPAEEHKQFETELKNDPVLKEEFLLYQKSRHAIQLLRRNYLKNRINDHINNAKTFRLPLWTRIAAAASMVVLICLISAFYASKKYCDQCLADASSFNIYLQSQRGEEYENPKVIQQIKDLILREEFNTAEQSIQQLSEEDRQQAEIRFLQVKIYKETGQWDQATNLLEDLHNSSSNIVADQADWQLVQLALLTSNEDKLWALLESITSNPNHGYYSQAKLLESKYQSLWRALVWF